MDAMIKEVENQKQALLANIVEKENLIADKLCKMEKSDSVLVTTFIADLVSNISSTKSLVPFQKQLVEMKALMASHCFNQKEGSFCVKFNDEQKQKLKSLISSFGVLHTNVDYKNDFTLLTTLDGSESGGAFKEPWGVTVCPFTDNVYVTDNSSIRVYNSDGVYIRHIVTNDSPSGIALDGNQRVIVTSFGESKVKIYNRDRKLVKCFGSKGDQSGQFNSPMGVVCDMDNNIYVADRENERIQVFTSDGTFKSEMGGDVLQRPLCLQINQRQELLVTDNDADEVMIFSLVDGQHLRSFPDEDDNSALCGPVGLCLDNLGHILVADSGNKMIKVYTDDGTHYCTITEPAVMNEMFGLAVTSSGVIFITDNKDNKIHLISTNCE